MIIEKHSTKGTYNYYGYFSNKIRYDSSKVITSGGNPRGEIKESCGGIVVLPADFCNLEELNNDCHNNISEYSWRVGKFFSGSFTYKDLVNFDENSICIEVLGITKEELVSFSCKFRFIGIAFSF